MFAGTHKTDTSINVSGVACPEENSITAYGSKGALTLTQWRVLKGRTTAEVVQGSSDDWQTFSIDVHTIHLIAITGAANSQQPEDTT